MPMLKSKQLKKYWKNVKKYGGKYSHLSYKQFIKEEAKGADEREHIRQLGDTYCDAASLLLERKCSGAQVVTREEIGQKLGYLKRSVS